MLTVYCCRVCPQTEQSRCAYSHSPLTKQEVDTKQRTTESSPNRRTSAFFTKSICEKGPTGTTLKTSLVWIPSRWRATLTFSKHRSTKNCTIIQDLAAHEGESPLGVLLLPPHHPAAGRGKVEEQFVHLGQQRQVLLDLDAQSRIVGQPRGTAFHSVAQLALVAQ